MKVLKIGLILSALSLFIFACAQNGTTNTNPASNTRATAENNAATANTNSAAQPVGTADELAEARKIYKETCIRCHKEDGKGGVTDLEGKKIKAPDFTSDKLKNEPDDEFIEIIRNGEKSDGMPAFKDRLNDEQIRNMVKLIRRDFQGKQ